MNMNETRVKRILADGLTDEGFLKSETDTYTRGKRQFWWGDWMKDFPETIYLNGYFSPKLLAAIAWWVAHRIEQARANDEELRCDNGENGIEEEEDP